jgi:hypothetical protein
VCSSDLEFRAQFKKTIFLCGESFLNHAQNSLCTLITDLDTSKQSTQKAFSCYDAILETGPTVSMRIELLVVHEKLGQFPLLTVYVVPCRLRSAFLSTFETAPFFCVCPVCLETRNVGVIRR